jgi:hypothetical protein
VPVFILVIFPALIDRLGRPRGLARQEAALVARRDRAGLHA